MGINVLSRRCLDFIPASGPFQMPELMLAMQRAGKPVLCYRTDCYWQDIGRFDDYQQASADFVRQPVEVPSPADMNNIPTALITGVCGFCASHLARVLTGESRMAQSLAAI